MKKFITLSALALVISVSAQEKKPDRMGGNPEHKMEMFDNLNLTDQQKADIKALYQEKKDDHQSLNAEHKDRKALSDAEKAEFKAKKEAQRNEFDAKLQKILTPEQYKQFTAERAKRHEAKNMNKMEKRE